MHETNKSSMPAERQSVTHSFHIGGSFSATIIVGLFKNGQPGELFIRAVSNGDQSTGVFDAWAIAISMGLQYGLPFGRLISKFIHLRFEPQGITDNPEIPIAL